MKTFSLVLVLLLSLVASVSAQVSNPVGPGPSPSASGGGSGTVTSITAGNGVNLSTSPCTTTCTIATTVTNNAQTGATYAVLSTDGGKIVSASNSSSEAYSIAAANTAGFTTGFGFDLNNIGAGVTTLTATTSLFDNGLATLALVKGQDAYIYSDGANYHTAVSLPVMATNTYLANTSGSTNYPVANSMASGIATFLATPTSANLAAAVTDETGSGSLVFGTSPTLATPVLGVAGATSLALGGATIGTDALGITGTMTISGAITAASVNATSTTIPANGIYLAGTNQTGISAASGLAMTFAGSGITPAKNILSSNAAGYELLLAAATSTAPNIIVDKAAATTGFGYQAAGNADVVATAIEIERWTATGPLIITLPTDATTTDNTLCINTTTHIVSSGSGTLGICLGTSSQRYKTSIVNEADGLEKILALRPKNFRYRKGYGDNGAREQYGFIAEDVVKVLPLLTTNDAQGRPNTVDILGMVPVLVKAVQEMQGEINKLGVAAIDLLRKEVIGLFLWNALLTIGLGFALVRKPRG